MGDAVRMQYRMVFCDIDGTLLDSRHHLSEATRDKVQELERMGVPFVLVSARMPSGVFAVQKELGICAPVVCYGGGLILGKDGNPIHSIGIGREKAAFIRDVVKEAGSGICCCAYSHCDWIVDNAHDPWVVAEHRITSSVPSEGVMSDFIPADGHVHKFLCMGNAKEITDLEALLRKRFPDLSIYRSKDTYLEVMDGAVLKSNAVKVLCREYGIPIEATVSFGDNFNDVDMLLATGLGFAMDNAPDDVKRKVPNRTLDNDHEGVLAVLRQLF